MTPGPVAVLGPLWSLALGVALGAAGALGCVNPGPSWLHWLGAVLGVGAAATAARYGFSRPALVLWILAGLALGGARGLSSRARALELVRDAERPGIVLRIDATVTSGWEAARWGSRARVALHGARHGTDRVRLGRTAVLEVRGMTAHGALPRPGSRIGALVRIRVRGHRLLLVAPSPRVVSVIAPPHGLAAVRAGLARSLLRAAGTRSRRIRAAELAAALALGRRDLIPAGRRQLWRRSGLAHLLAVSGLHVGVAAGLVWLVAILLGASPAVARALVVVLTPAYALLAGAAPSALRATLMVVAYAGARLVGRAIVPMAAVLLAAVVLLLASPPLIADAGFQLTVGITAALVRWTGPLAARLPGPRWLRAAVAVPLVAQAAAVPFVAWHFRTVLPGAVVTNLLALPLLLPVLALAMAATVLAPVSVALAAPLLGLLGDGARLLLEAGALSRSLQLTAPSWPVWLICSFLAAGTIALLPGKTARAGGTLWLAGLVLVPAWWLVRPASPVRRVMLLPVADGLAALIPTGTRPILADGGRWHAQACQLLADRRVRRLAAVIASHTDEDHIGGLRAVLAGVDTGQLILPRWMMADPAAVGLLRAARRRGIRIVPACRGLVIDAGNDRLDVLWPPAAGGPDRENDRSLVALVRTAHGSVLVTSDISSTIERRLEDAHVALHAQVLIIAHHGSQTSSSLPFLRAVAPDVALIPAGPLNPYHHPNAAVLARLRRLAIPYRYPKRDGLCGAVPARARWRPFP